MSFLVNWLWAKPAPAASEENMIARPRGRSRARRLKEIERRMCSESPPPRDVQTAARLEYEQDRMEEQADRIADQLTIATAHYYYQQGIREIQLELRNMVRHNKHPHGLGHYDYTAEDCLFAVDRKLDHFLSRLQTRYDDTQPDSRVADDSQTQGSADDRQDRDHT